MVYILHVILYHTQEIVGVDAAQVTNFRKVVSKQWEDEVNNISQIRLSNHFKAMTKSTADLKKHTDKIPAYGEKDKGKKWEDADDKAWTDKVNANKTGKLYDALEKDLDNMKGTLVAIGLKEGCAESAEASKECDKELYRVECLLAVVTALVTLGGKKIKQASTREDALACLAQTWGLIEAEERKLEVPQVIKDRICKAMQEDLAPEGEKAEKKTETVQTEGPVKKARKKRAKK